MKRNVRAVLFAGAASSGLILGTAWAQTGEDDLAVVKKAVAASQAPEAPAKASPPAPRKSGKAEPQWLKVRVTEKGSKKGKVSVNLPLALVRAMEDWPIDFHCHGKEDAAEKRCTLKIGQVLKALESGQDLVEVDDEEASVRIWVE